MRALTGLSAAQVRRSRMQAPGSMLWIEFVEFKGVDRNALRMKIQDRGAARIQLRVQNVDSIVAAMKSGGWKVASEGGVAVPIRQISGCTRRRSKQFLPDSVRAL